LLYIDRKLVMPTNIHLDSLRDEPVIRELLVEKLKPKQDDEIIIGSSDTNPKTAELASKNAALYTLVTHEKHPK